jgi:hypothetical protein
LRVHGTRVATARPAHRDVDLDASNGIACEAIQRLDIERGASALATDVGARARPSASRRHPLSEARSMPSQKLVRCLIQPVDRSAPPSPRFVPLEIFGLWEHLMASRHGFRVEKACASLWLDVEDAPVTGYEEHAVERVTEVTAFVQSPREEMLIRTCRYFPTDECDRLKSIFLTHYAEGDPKVHERPGIWVHPEAREQHV